MSNLTRKGFLGGVAGTIVIGSLAACGSNNASSAASTADSSAASSAVEKIDLASASEAELEIHRSIIRNAVSLLIDRTYICEQIAQAD
ncbi:MAG: hypothetical protein Q4B54_03855, partial [Coriobacteriales bacterium]|nr:hypothetical protein [Coriobacteriales bacterium]